ncbi:hypothetical protein [Geosporobacter ferrireducens]|uniref:Uncharacterized protein n=1 Tax=Geosporobacter ferrireducens TaxID=1424294 RepID=A0A1D8GN92_9FIRM|nr:hypothetical protein [Geosporobacter ferrireducens]AOT72347.1 hypothetical protein Gferi_24040 [Geosporobacter ferrireducens]MTI56398.1 hypothetical protein [Geosporobacter ferrireducens]
MKEMNMDQIRSLMEFMGGDKLRDEHLHMLEELSELYRGKTEENIMDELVLLNMMISQDSQSYQNQLNMLEQMRFFMNDEQKKRLDYVMKYIHKNSAVDDLE